MNYTDRQIIDSNRRTRMPAGLLIARLGILFALICLVATSVMLLA